MYMVLSWDLFPFKLSYENSQERSEILEFIILNFVRCVLLDTLLHPFIQVGKKEKNIIYVCVLFECRKVPCLVKNHEEEGIQKLILLLELMSWTSDTGLQFQIYKPFWVSAPRDFIQIISAFQKSFNFYCTSVWEKKNSQPNTKPRIKKIFTVWVRPWRILWDMTAVFCWERYVRKGFYKDSAVSVWEVFPL